MISLTSVKSSSSSSVLPISISRLLSGDYTQSVDIGSRYIDCQDVRITPSPMTFENAFEGKSYNKKFTVQNLGKTAAFIRICPASSYAFQIKPIIRGQRLCPGLTITKYVTYTYMRATAVPFAAISIYVNDEHVNHKLVVLLSGVSISAIPQQIDFGTIDAGHSGAVRMLSLHNTGSKGTRFAIDLGRNEMDLIVEPSKGIIQPLSKATFRVECLGKKEGSFSREFWIKCEIPLRIQVTGTIISPQFHSYHPNTTEDFTLIDFPKTYFGTSYIKTMVIRNYSSCPAVYCTLAELPDKTMAVQEAQQHKPDYLNFNSSPLEGTLHPYEGRIFHFTYTPIQDKTKKKDLQAGISFCSIQIVRVPCTDLSQIIMPAVEISEDIGSGHSATEDTVSAISITLSLNDDSFPPDTAEIFAHPKGEVCLERNVRVVLYGEAETAGIITRPDELHLLQIPLNVTVTREILLVNKSAALPIIFSYKKVSFVNVVPNYDMLPPSGKLEVCVNVTATNIGKVKTKIAFDLLFCNQPREDDNYVVIGYAEVPLTFEVQVSSSPKPKFNMGITPKYVKEVGCFTDDVRFNTKIAMPRATLMKSIKKNCSNNDNDLVAFPNDRPKSLRQWKSPIPCRTICGNIPRFVNTARDSTYQLSKKVSMLKHQNDSYYRRYLRQEAELLKKLREVPKEGFSDYDISKKYLLESDFPKPKYFSDKEDKTKKPSFFIPLTPLQLNKIKVQPQDIKLKKMAPRTSTTTKVTIHNQNDFSIRIFARPRKSVITFPEGERKDVKSFSKTQILLTYNSLSVFGHNSVIVDFIVNGSNTFVVSITVNVVPKCVRFTHKDIIFGADENLGKYLNVYNPVNVPIKFQWIIPESCFAVEPLSGIIPAGRHLTCYMSYVPHHEAQSTIEVALSSENGRRQMISVTADIEHPKVKLKSSKIEFQNIPLNLPLQGTAVLQNLGREPVTFAIINARPLPGVSIQPTEGIIYGLAEQIFVISLQISACIKFSCSIQIKIQKIKIIKLDVSGTVVYPNVMLKPESLQLQKIVANAFDRQVFIIANKSSAMATIDFLLQDYTEYTILGSRSNDYSTPITKLELQACEQKELYLHFHPVGAALFRFYLPVLINGILGPTILNTGESLRPNFYTEINEKRYRSLSSVAVAVVDIPKILPVLVIHSTVVGDTVRFSKMHLNFKYFPDPEFNSETEIELKIWNGSKDTCKFCIRTDLLCAPFSLTYLTGSKITVLNYSIVCTLAPKEEVTLKAEFAPNLPGNYHVQLPIYVKNYLEGNIFNYLTLSGWYPNPTISTLEKDIYFEAVPLRCEIENCLCLRLKYHPKPCTVLARSDTNDFKVAVGKSTPAKGKFAKEAQVTFKYSTGNPKSFTTNVKFFCECGAKFNVTIKGCVDNCTLTTHAFMRAYIKSLLGQPPGPVSSKSSCQDLPFILSKSPIECTDTITLSTNLSTANDYELLTNYNDSPFPVFPGDDDQTEYGVHMRTTIKALEEWLFHQGFYGNCYFKVPEGIAIPPESKSPQDDNQKKKKRSEKVSVLKFVELLINIVGQQVSNYIPIRELPDDHLKKVNYMYNVYSKAKEFIMNQGGLLPHVLPEHLLIYSDYLVFLKSVRPFLTEFVGEQIPDILDEKKFYFISKQSWLDLLLQTYKVFVLSQIRIPEQVLKGASNTTISIKFPEASHPSLSISYFSYTEHSSTTVTKGSIITKTNSETEQSKGNSKQASRNLFKEESRVSCRTNDDAKFWREFLRADRKNTNIFGESESILLHWLEHNFNNQREVLWGPNSHHQQQHGEIMPETRKILYFDCDLNDGLVLIAITSACCPYLRPYFNEVYPHPTCMEEAFHNISKLLQSWKKINLSFDLTPKQIINPNNVQMLMLVNYLYEVLPSFYPRNIMRFRTGLSTTCTKQLSVENMSSSAITYNIIFFGNERGFFSVRSTSINLQPWGKYKLTITFYAKKLCFEQVTLVLNGEKFGRCYAKAMAFTLEGESIPSYCTTTVTIPAPLYNVLELDLPIQSPYPGPASFDINFSLVEPNDVMTCKLIPWATARKYKIPKRMATTNKHLEVDKDGLGFLHVMIGCITTNEKAIWAIWTHPELGDFTTKIVTIPQVTEKMYTPVTVVLPQNYEVFRCHCKIEDKSTINKQCPRTVFIPVPCRNDFLWNVVTDVMMKTVDEKNLPFWKNYLGTGAGVRLNKWMVEQQADNEGYYDIQTIFESSVTYTITLETCNACVMLPPTTTIENVHSLERHEIPVHVDSNVNLPLDFHFKMESTNGLELRYYSVNLLTEKQSTNNILV